MKQYSAEEISELIHVKGGNEGEQAAALAVVMSAIRESRRLGRIALRAPKSSWSKNPNILRADIGSSWSASSRPGL
ncbi:MAG: hypothetical protein K9G13_06970 [Aquiluna sp.]|nr:hypothetical protein [Aquiluna sp.]MCF8546260.1 hypothetical protein [Aquiluna sp.]